MSLEAQAQVEYDDAQDSTYDLASAIIDWVATPSGAQALFDAKITTDHLLTTVPQERIAREIMEWVYTYREKHEEWPVAERVYEHFRQHYRDDDGMALEAERPGRIPVSDLAERLHTRKLRNDAMMAMEQWAIRGEEDALANLNFLLQELTAVARGASYGQEEFLPKNLTGDDIIELYEALSTSQIARIPTGFELCDKKWNGGYRGLTFILGRMGGFKSWMVSNSAHAAAWAGHDVVVYTLELQAEEWMMRYIAQSTNTSWDRLDGAVLSQTEKDAIRDRYDEMIADMAGSLHIIYPPEDQRTVTAMRAQAESLGATVVYIDQLNQITPPDGRFNADHEMMHKFIPPMKAWANSLDGALIIAHQRNRLAEEKKKKHNFGTDTVSRSDVITQWADMVVSTSQLDDQKRVGAFTFGTLKNRNGPYVHFDFATNFTSACQIKCIGLYHGDEE